MRIVRYLTDKILTDPLKYNTHSSTKLFQISAYITTFWWINPHPLEFSILYPIKKLCYMVTAHVLLLLIIDNGYYLPKVTHCTDQLQEFVYGKKDIGNIPSKKLPELVRRFLEDVYLCIYIDRDGVMYQ